MVEWGIKKDRRDIVIKEYILWGMLLVCILFLAGCSEKDLPSKSEDGALTYAALNKPSEQVLSSIEDFNEKHPDTPIEILDYSDESRLERLRTELALGRVPDIMEMYRAGKGDDIVSLSKIYEERPEGEYWMPYRQMAEKGYLENLWPYIRRDEAELKYGQNGLQETPLKAAEVNGGLYLIFQRVTINTLVGPQRLVGDRCGWTFEELMETFSAMPEGSSILRHYLTQADMFRQMAVPLLDQYVDWRTGQCAFDSDGFRELLVFLASFPDEFQTLLSQNALYEECAQRMLGGKQMLEAASCAGVIIVTGLDTHFDDQVTFVGYPTSDGSPGSMFVPHGTILAMSSACRNKEAAWTYMSQLLNRNIRSASQTENMYAFKIKTPINKTDYLLVSKYQLARYTMVTGGPSDFLSPNLVSIDTPDKQDKERFDALIDNTCLFYWPDDALADVVWESIGPYLAGDRGLDDTIALVQNRAMLYVNENR